MLKALYDYALREDLILPAGYVKKNVRAYVSLSKDGKFLDIMPGQEEKVPCPDIGSMANSGDKCNVLAENAVSSSRAMKSNGRSTPPKPRTFGRPWRMPPKWSPGWRFV